MFNKDLFSVAVLYSLKSPLREQSKAKAVLDFLGRILDTEHKLLK